MENLIYNDGKVIIFPITKDELRILSQSFVDFMVAINLNYGCQKYDKPEKIIEKIEFLEKNPENPERNTFWMILKIDERKIVGHLCLTENKDGKIGFETYLADGYDEKIMKRAILLLADYEKECNVKIDYETNDFSKGMV